MSQAKRLNTQKLQYHKIIINFHPSFSYHVKPSLSIKSILSIQIAREEKNAKGKIHQ